MADRKRLIYRYFRLREISSRKPEICKEEVSALYSCVQFMKLLILETKLLIDSLLSNFAISAIFDKICFELCSPERDTDGKADREKETETERERERERERKRQRQSN